ncbi:STAS domain-containing protein [Streptomyces niveus]|uniref:STAS domain-containing protein n=1 Tax=Streptomyces niveus TaxID=193462 RepID=UPI0034194BD8
MRWRSGRLPTAGAWLLVAAVAVGAGAWPEPVYLKIVLLIAAATALRLALTGIWPQMRSTQSSAPVPGGKLVRVRLYGEIDADNAERYARDMKEALGPDTAILEIDMSRVDHVSRTGTPALFDTVSAARRADVRVVVSHASQPVRTMLHSVGLDRFVEYNGSPLP